MAKKRQEKAPSPAIAAVQEAIKALEQDGRLTPESVVEAARSPRSPLHGHFEWDETKAAHAYRLDQARALIRSVQVIVHTEGRVISTVHYVRDPGVEAEEQGYVSLARLRSEPENARAMVRMEFARASACLRRAEDLADALGLRAEVASVARKVERLGKRIEQRSHT